MKRTCEAQRCKDFGVLDPQKFLSCLFSSTLYVHEFINMQSWPFDQFPGIKQTSGDTINGEADLDTISPKSPSIRLTEE